MSAEDEFIDCVRSYQVCCSYQALVTINGRTLCLGTFASEREARDAIRIAERLANWLCRKSRVKELFEKEGAEAATVLGIKLRLKRSTLATWIATWRREGLAPWDGVCTSKTVRSASISHL